MGRREVYCIDERQQIYFTRWELDDQPVEVEEKQKTTPYRHKEYPTRCIRWTGLHFTQYADHPVKQVLGSQICDAGAAGISVAVESLPGGCVPTQEERDAGRERIRQAIEHIFSCRCYWKGEDSAPDLDTIHQHRG